MNAPILSREGLRRLARTSRQWEPIWRFAFNFRATVGYRLTRQSLTGEATRVVEDLDRDGVAITSAAALLGHPSVFEELQDSVAELERSLEPELSTARERAREITTVTDEKAFVHSLLGDRPVLDPASVFARMAIGRPVLQIANAYYRMHTRLRYYDVWHTFVTTAQPGASQLWHHDRDDLHFVLKMFLYLSDVDGGAGPFTYARGSHSRGDLRREPPYLFKDGNTARSDDDQMSEVVPRSRWLEAVGPRGTIVFADTRGYHKGGLAREHERILYTCMFTSPFAQPLPAREVFQRRSEVTLPDDKEQALALSPRRERR